MNLGEKLYKYRKDNGWSQEEFAEKLNVSRQTVSKWEMGKAIPELEKLIKISELYQVTIDDLVKDNYEINSNGKNKQDNKLKYKKLKKIM